MTNHVHLILEPTTESLAVGVHRFSGRYAQHFNRRHKRRGYVFQGRFRSILVEDGGYLRSLARYIHLNPVEARLVVRPEQYPWSSHNAYFNRTAYAWLHTDRVLSHFGSSRSEALANMLVHLEAKMDAASDGEEIRRAFRMGAYGSEEFTKVYADKESGSLLEQGLEGNAPNIDLLTQAVCTRLNVTIDELRCADKRRELVAARAILARAAQLAKGLKLRAVCEVLYKHHGTVSRLAGCARKDQQLNELASQLAEDLS